MRKPAKQARRRRQPSRASAVAVPEPGLAGADYGLGAVCDPSFRKTLETWFLTVFSLT